jgi:acetyl-CoA synthetase
MFRSYLDDPDRYARAFADGWYLSGDLARIDADGYVWFIGRADDVIKSAGRLIGPFEVESALMEHPAVAPREIAFDQNLPRTRSGKVMRRLLRTRELCLPTGDLPTLEGSA